MNRLDVIELYKQGYSIDYIINKFYNHEKFYNKIITTKNKKIIIINSPLKKSDIKREVYNMIYNEKMKKSPRI